MSDDERAIIARLNKHWRMGYSAGTRDAKLAIEYLRTLPVEEKEVEQTVVCHSATYCALHQTSQ